jgi:hypothetical protein
MTQFHLEWEMFPSLHFRTGVSLHSHTLHSREGLDFIYSVAARVPILAAAIRRGERSFAKIHGTRLDFKQGWWTPPLGAHQAWSLEKRQLTNLDLEALVSLTDHDDIEAPVSLQLLEECRQTPISVEWTAPVGPTFFHFGVHNLPPAVARTWFETMDAYRVAPQPARLKEILAALSAMPEVLVVFNHPLWDERGIGQGAHEQVVHEFLLHHKQFVHALELNGLRPWAENHAAVLLARQYAKPVVSGGDRHGFEPNAVVNLTNAGTFEEFVEDVRDGISDVLILRHYRESHASRIAHNMIDILRTHHQHVHGWKLWSDRAFYKMDDGRVQSLTEWFGDRPPFAVTAFVGALEFASLPRIRRWLRSGFMGREEVVL